MVSRLQKLVGEPTVKKDTAQEAHMEVPVQKQIRKRGGDGREATAARQPRAPVSLSPSSDSSSDSEGLTSSSSTEHGTRAQHE